MFSNMKFLIPVVGLLILIANSSAVDNNIESKAVERKSDLDTSATSAKLLGLFNPNYGYNYGTSSYPSYRPTYYYPTTGSYYPTTGGNYYPSTSWTGSSYPNVYYNNPGSYYPSTSGTYYPTSGYYPTGTNILGGNGGYGGYGGNGGLGQYYGYWNKDYTGARNRGYGYYTDTDRYGLPTRDRSDYYGREMDRDYGRGSYRGFD
ncbi:prisilkin-39-like [Teleopsis dalmanni]|uniref:prisilkin-39-like n=1 Tax=Teleopsis dalmanni TaxID=139649 RepID=UPI0018CFD899|nr:prisilkin-39-like [Teleopsis dalmanni]